MSENTPSRPLILGHRGASAYAPENTLAAFRLAREQGADGIELDAKLSADGFVVVMHDTTVDRTTNGTGKVSALTYYELRQLDAGSWYNQKYRGEPIPTLEDVFSAVGRDLLVNVELTNYTTLADALPEKVAALVIKMDLEKQVDLLVLFPDQPGEDPQIPANRAPGSTDPRRGSGGALALHVGWECAQGSAASLLFGCDRQAWWNATTGRAAR